MLIINATVKLLRSVKEEVFRGGIPYKFSSIELQRTAILAIAHTK
jgi:hypothetical protein